MLIVNTDNLYIETLETIFFLILGIFALDYLSSKYTIVVHKNILKCIYNICVCTICI